MNRMIRMAGAAVLALALSGAAAQAADRGAAINGEVRKIDERTGKITLKHGPATSLGMDEPMTMVYRVKDPAMLKQVKVGDKVQFDVESGDTGYTVTRIQTSK
ncbi:RND transporter [Bradyrhizobium sp. LTSPM299]|jgi:Cu(I)/Ag(I) efflux system periplasmic protein CusF|uniref:copper-binding protein n=1 Tax=Bradyrhizobium sp. LTSPM299 TaxID=1619233 RepID=UPI0005CB7062|nr:copper-binding protein [Bradyrhizobium sp. LTSPM299]KJC62269.1 RND transporter [Bradyrhizobium sp. LTSPM299]